MAKIKIITGLLFCCAAAGLLLLIFHWRDQLHRVPTVNNQAADAFASGIKSKQFDVEGNVLREFSADDISVFENENRATAKKPYLSAKLDNGKPIDITAKQGWLQDKDHVKLEGGVEINTVTQTNLPITLRSENLDYSIAKETATTQADMSIDSPQNFHFTAKGATADFKQEKYIFHEQVRGIYEPRTQ